jgi:hypothetical protein
MSKHKQGFFASVRPALSILGVGLMAGMLVTLSTAPARADTIGCGVAVELLVQWTTREASQGLSSDMLEDLQELAPVLSECTGLGARPEPGPRAEGADVYRGVGSDVERWRPLVALYFRSEQLDRAMCLMTAESGGNSDAWNPTSGATGLMQVMPFWAGVFGYSHDDLFRPDVNLWVAGQILEEQGWGAWTPYLRGACR